MKTTKILKKSLKYSLIIFLSIVLLLFINGTYYVFWGQEKSVAKLQQGKELNLYECCSIYTMHMAVWMFGWPIAPEAAQQAYFMMFSKEPRSVSNSYFLKTEEKETLRYKLAFPDDLEIKYIEFEDWFYDLLDNRISFTNKMYYCSFQVTYSDTIYNIYNIKIYGKLLKYIQDKNWIHEHTISYTG